MKILSWNVNGIRAAVRKGFMDWFYAEAPDVMCLQEIKATPNDLTKEQPSVKGIVAWLF